MNENKSYDCIIVGGGLAGSLLFYGLKATRPEAQVLLLEEASVIGGNHTWCFHEADISFSKSTWIRELISKSWPGYEVIFPKYTRVLNTAYHAIQSEKLHKILMQNYSQDILLKTQASLLQRDGVILTNGEKLSGKCIVDARGWRDDGNEHCGYQKFVGMDLKLKRPHHFQRVRLKDARVEQIDGYRFVYTLSWSEDEVLIEDTYYSNTSFLDVEEIKKRILSYAQKEGLEVERILRVESGCLPLVSSWQAEEQSEVVVLGARSGDYQPVTGYTFPQTFLRIDELLSIASFDAERWKEKLRECQQQDKRQRRYFHFLNKMLFHAATPDKRYVVLERFYRFPQHMIERFYRGKFTRFDQLRLLVGKPPVSIIKAIKALIK